MKYFFVILIFTLLMSIYSKGIYAINYVEKNIYQKNTILNIKGSKLIKKYLSNLLNNLNELKIKYNLATNSEIKNYSKTLNSMIRLLSRIETTNISKNKAEEVMRIIIRVLKPLNMKIKKLIKKEKQKQVKKTDKIKGQYYYLSLKLSLTLNKIIIKFYIPIKDKRNLTVREKKIFQILRNLKQNSDSLKNIKKLNLQDIFKVKKELLNILKKIKNNLYILKNT